MKLFHCSDVHLGRRPVGGVGEYSSKRFDDYFAAFGWAVDLAIAKTADVFMISGDFFDRKELLPEIVRRAEDCLLKLKESGIPVILIEGNHDNITTGSESDSWLIYLENKGYFKRPYIISINEQLFEFAEIKGIKFYGTGFQGSFSNEALAALANFLEDKKGEQNVVLVHSAISKGAGFHGTITEDTAKLFAGKAIYVAGGHFHSFDAYPPESPYFFLPGSLEYWDSEEFGKAKGVIIFDTDTREYEFIESPKRHALKIVVDSNATDNDYLISELEQLAQLNDIQKGETLIHLTLNLANSFPADVGRIEDMLDSKGALKSFIRIILPGTLTQKDMSNPLLGTEQAEQEIINGWDYFSAEPDKTFELLQKMKEYQQESKQDLFIAEVDALLESMLSKEANDEN